MIPGGVNKDGMEGMRLWKLMGYTDKELLDELQRREEEKEVAEEQRFKKVLAKIDGKTKNIGHFGHLIDVTENPAWCSECEEWFDI